MRLNMKKRRRRRRRRGCSCLHYDEMAMFYKRPRRAKIQKHHTSYQGSMTVPDSK